MVKNAVYVGVIGAVLAIIGVETLQFRLPIGPIVLLMALFPLAGLILARRSLKRAVPDLVFGIIDTSLLTILALWGGIIYGVAGAIAGGVIGDALTDSVAGFFEGAVAEWFRERGVEESREQITTALGKMAGCLFGSGLVLSIALAFGIRPPIT